MLWEDSINENFFFFLRDSEELTTCHKIKTVENYIMGVVYLRKAKASWCSNP